MEDVQTTTTGRLAASAALVLAVAAMLLVAPSLALFMAPAAMLLLLLVNGRMPGEQVLTRLRERRRRAPRRRPASALVPGLPVVVRRTGRRIAFALAVRPPPAVSLHLH